MHTFATCLVRSKLLSNVTPRFLADNEGSMSASPIVTEESGDAQRNLLLICNISVFESFNFNLLETIHALDPFSLGNHTCFATSLRHSIKNFNKKNATAQ